MTARPQSTYPATSAREAAGLTLEQAAKAARITPAYLRRKEREGGFAQPVASRLARRYGCSLSVFLRHRREANPNETGGAAKADSDRKDLIPGGWKLHESNLPYPADNVHKSLMLALDNTGEGG